MKYLFLLSLICFSNTIFSQKQDYIWFFGSDQSAAPGVQGIKFDFNKSPFQPETRDTGLEYDQVNSSICDAEGNLLFYTNGCAINNKEHELMENGDRINYGLFFQELWLDDCGNGYPGRQDIITLTDPGNPDGYYIIHKRVSYFPNQEPDILFDSLLFTYVDMTQNNGLGAVVEKNEAFAVDTFLFSYLTAMQHDNQKDWWILQPEKYSDRIHVYLLDEMGFQFDHFETAENGFPAPFSSAAGEAKFSPDGNKYGIYSQVFGFHLFDFDRTSGSLSNPIYYPRSIPPSPFEAGFSTLEFSPNSRFIYLAIRDSLWQLDTWEDNLEDGDVLIDTWNGVQDPFSTTFFLSTLGPDCRIYIRSGSSTNSFHLIHHPNEKGLDCGFEQQALPLPYVSSTGGFTNPPRWRVDEEEPCDPTLVTGLIDISYEKIELSLYPNPASDYVQFRLPTSYPAGSFYIVDIQGKIVYQEEITFSLGPHQVNINDFAAGHYMCEFVPDDLDGERVFFSGRFEKVD